MCCPKRKQLRIIEIENVDGNLMPKGPGNAAFFQNYQRHEHLGKWINFLVHNFDPCIRHNT